MKAAKLFHPSVVTPSIFPFLYCDYDFAAVKQSLPCLKNPLPAPAGPAVPRCATGAALQQAELFRHLKLGNVVCCWCTEKTRNHHSPLGLSSSFSSPHPRAEHGISWQPASHRVETMHLSSLEELFIWSSTNFAQVQESSKLCVYFLCHCSQWFAVLKYVCAGSMYSPIIFIASFRKLLFTSKD